MPRSICHALIQLGISEVHYMAGISVMASIAERGILPFNALKRARIASRSLANRDVQARRGNTRIVNIELHEFVPLYFATHTPMQYEIEHRNRFDSDDLFMLDVSVKRIGEVARLLYFTDRNAACSDVEFRDKPEHLATIDWHIVQKVQEVLVSRLQSPKSGRAARLSQSRNTMHCADRHPFGRSAATDPSFPKKASRPRGNRPLSLFQMIKETTASLFDLRVDAIVNTVNCVGVMGKGIASEFKTRFPKCFAPYQRACKENKLRPGKPVYLAPEDRSPGILLFPTKDDWKHPSRTEWIEAGLGYLRNHYRDWGIRSIAMPQLGCGEGGLNWTEVRPLIHSILGNTDLDITLCIREAAR